MQQTSESKTPELRETDIRAVLFDLDDTLVDRRGAYDIFYRSFFDKNDALNDLLSWPEAKDFFWTLSPDNATDPRQAFEVIQARWPEISGDPDSHFHKYFESMVANMRPLPGALELAEALNSSGIPWGVVTNGDQYQLEKVKSSGMQDLIPFVIATKLHGASKPDPESYLHAVRLLEMKEADARQILFVGDNPHTDIIGAHGVGMQTAWIHMGREYPADVQKPHLTIDGVTDLYEVLDL